MPEDAARSKERKLEKALHCAIDLADAGEHRRATVIFLAAALDAALDLPEQRSIALELAARSLEEVPALKDKLASVRALKAADHA